MTDIVVDANFCLAQVLILPYSQDVTRRLTLWQTELPRLIVPSLWEYEVVTGLRRARVQGLLNQDDLEDSLEQLFGMDLEVIPPSLVRHRLALTWAERLGQIRTYDGQYLALAEEQGAEFWTADRRLANGAHSQNLNWVHWVGEP